MLKFDSCFKDAILSGEKRSTVRRSLKASVGDRFTIDGHDFVVTSVQSLLLDDACSDHYKDDGFRCAQDMYESLLGFYPDLELTKSIVWIHFFRAV